MLTETNRRVNIKMKKFLHTGKLLNRHSLDGQVRDVIRGDGIEITGIVVLSNADPKRTYD